MNDQSLLSNVVNSEQFQSALEAQYQCHENIKYHADCMNQQIIETGEFVCREYDRLRNEYNEGKKNESVFILPEVRINLVNGRSYPTFRWVQFMNNQYLGNCYSNKKWTIREINKRGKLHFSRADFLRAMNNKNLDFLPTMLAAEHCLRACRERYQLVNTLASVARKIKLSEYHSYFTSKISVDLDPDDEILVKNALKANEEGRFLFDPLEVSTKDSLFDSFYTLPEEVDSSDPDEWDYPDEIDWKLAEEARYSRSYPDLLFLNGSYDTVHANVRFGNQ